jgi:nucleoid DNA-binding protein
MNKAELIDAVQRELGQDCSKAHAERAVNSVLKSIGSGLEKDSNVQLVGFGSFIVRERKARTGLNPQTKLPIEIPASKTVGFRPGAKLKETL